MRVVVWSSVLSLTAALVLLLCDPPATTSVSQSTRAAPATARDPRCGPGTLEDHGVCVPVPARAGAGSEDDVAGGSDFVPKLPGLPDALGEYTLPSPERAELVRLSSASKWAGPTVVGPALSIRASSGTRVPLRELLGSGALLVLALDRAERWLLLGRRPPASHERPVLLLLNGVSVSQEVQPDQALSDAAEIHVADERWTLHARQLRPGEALVSGVESLRAERSIAVDVRNVLVPKAPAPQNTEPQSTEPQSTNL